MEKNSERLNKDLQRGYNTLPSSVKDKMGGLDNTSSLNSKIMSLSEKKGNIKFKSWKKSIINALTFLDNDYDLGMPGGKKNKQVFKDNLINLLGECPNYNCMSKILKKTFKNKEIIDNIMDKAYENYSTNGLGKRKKDESTTTASAGQYSGPLFGGNPKFKSNIKIKKSEIEEMIKESISADESTTASSAGQYVGPAMWAKDRDNWRGRLKTWKGGKFVSVKEKCKRYPYCNQSPEAITLSNVPLDKLDNVFENLSKKTNKPYSYIKRMFFKHFDVK